MVNLLSKVLSDPIERVFKKYKPLLQKVNALEPDFERLSDDGLRGKTDEFKARLAQGEKLDDLMPEAFAAVREAAKRTLGQRHFDVQLIGGNVLHRGQIAEMKTGEGKTLVATLSAYLNGLTGLGVHVVTVNDYLAKRDPVWMGPIYHLLGLSVGCLQHQSAYIYDPSEEGEDPTLRHLRPVTRREAYQADITHGTNNEFGFDYLRDNMATDPSQLVRRGMYYAIVDEVDNILIDEARTPLIISGPAEEPVELYSTFAKLVPRLSEGEDADYTLDEKGLHVSLTENGIASMEKWTKVGNLYDADNYHLVHFIENALTANILKKRDKDYVVRDGEVVIVDEFTGRLQPGRRWSDGLHQAVEAKEGIRVQRESITYATITLQNYFRMYEKLAGMTGTAATESEEFFKIYRLDVASIPTNQPLIRTELPERIYQTQEAKWKAVTDEIAELQKKGCPILVGTTSIENSEHLSELLNKRGLRHQVLNAKIHDKEATVVARAGEPGAITVATNMAGRGTDIILGGNPAAEGVSPEVWQKDHDKVVSLGGLHVIGTDHHDARRIDNQLRGRSGRQGDPGISRFYSSLEDDLIRRFGGDRIKGFMGWMGVEADVPIENRMVAKSIGTAQVRVEGHHFEIRKQLLEYDEVLNTQRNVIYDRRRKTLDGEGTRDQVIDSMIRPELQSLVRNFLPDSNQDTWDSASLLTELNTIFPNLPREISDEESMGQLTDEQVARKLHEYAEEAYQEREQELGEDDMRLLERLLILRNIDVNWVQHLTTMENLRQGVGLHAFGQRDPLMVYRTEGHKMFQALLQRLQHDLVHTIYRASIGPSNGNRKPLPTPMQRVAPTGREAVPADGRKVGRNDPCPCGSGKKYKRCHGTGG